MCIVKGLLKWGKNLIMKTSFQIEVNFDCKFCVLFYVILIEEKFVEIVIFNDIFFLAAIILRAKSFQIIISFHIYVLQYC